MAFNRTGAPAPTTTVNTTVSGATASRVAALQRSGPQAGALQAASPSVPVEITAADGQHLTVSFGDVRNFICQQATDAECKIFLETCKAYHLNPFTKEAYLIHYDNKNADTASTIVLGKNCYMQMAERNPAYDGFEAGVITLDKEAGKVPSSTKARSFWAAGRRSTARIVPAPTMRKSASASTTPATPSGPSRRPP